MNILDEVSKMSAEEQIAMAVAIQKAASDKLQQNRSETLGKSVEVVVQGLKKIKSDLEVRFDELNNVMQTKVSAIAKGRDGEPGRDGKDGQDGRIGVDGMPGQPGVDGKDGEDGEDGISVVNAFVDFDGGLTIVLSDGREINAGEVIPMDVAEKIKVITNGGGTSQSVLDSIASLQAQITNITGSTINNTTIGVTTASTGKFTTLESTGTASLATGSTTSIQAIGDASYPGIYAAGGTNTPLVLQPLGTGALQAQKTTSTIVGGNARGANAVDLQTTRVSAVQVASGTGSVVSGGLNNTSNSSYTVVGGGANNVASGFISVVCGGNTNLSTGLYSSSVGGLSNTSSGPYANIVGGQLNTSAGYYNFIGAGFTNSGTANAAVTTQSATMNATTAVTLSGSNASIKVGQYITGTSIASDTYVAAISGTSLTLSKVASGSSTSTLSFFTPHGVVVGGGNNQATGAYSFIGGGGDAGTAANRNVASGYGSCVVGGFKNTASGEGSFVGSGGIYDIASGGFSGNTASGLSSFIGSGFGNTASSNASVISGGVANVANGIYSTIVGGTYGTTRGLLTNIVFPASNAPFGGTGQAQSALLILARQTTDTTTLVLTCNGTTAGTINQVILPNNSAYFFRGEIVSGVTGGGDTKGWTIEGVIKRGANAASTALVGTPTIVSTYADVGAATWAIAVTADTTNGGIKVTFTGQAATTIRTVCQIRTTEMTY